MEMGFCLRLSRSRLVPVVMLLDVRRSSPGASAPGREPRGDQRERKRGQEAQERVADSVERRRRGYASPCALILLSPDLPGGLGSCELYVITDHATRATGHTAAHHH